MQSIPITLPLIFILFLLAGCDKIEDTPWEESEKNIFTDITGQVNLNFIHNPGVDGSYFMPESIGSGNAFLDFDNDGDLDIYLINGAWHGKNTPGKPSLKNHLYRQESDGTFVDVTEFSGLGDTGYGMGVAAGDIDNDGNVDLYISNVGHDALYRNNGDGTFSNISRAAGITNPNWGCSIAFLDYNLDGFLDIYITNYLEYNRSVICRDKAGRPDYCGPTGFAGVPDILYRNNGDGTFTDKSVASGIAKGASKGLGVASGHFNDDLFPDIYVANDGEANHLWINRGDGTFRDLGLLNGAALNALGSAEASMGIALGDIDADSNLDLFVTHLRGESNTLYRNTGENGFWDETTSTRLAGPGIPFTGFGSGFFDYDNDGDLDLAIANGRVTRGLLLVDRKNTNYWDDYAEPNMLFENNGSGRFQNISGFAKGFCAKIENSRGLAFGDVDNDGDIDLLLSNSGGKARLIRNDVAGKGHWLIVRLIDPTSKSTVTGAKITAVVNGKKIHRQVAPYYSYLSSNDPRVHFGLGSATVVEEILIQWPDGKKQSFSGVTANQIITLEKG